jgi:sugar (pentulose or hexulose) kinase
VALLPIDLGTTEFKVAAYDLQRICLRTASADPSTGKPLTTVAEADTQVIDLTVRAGPQALEAGP